MRKVLIMGAAGRDFHNFNVFYRNNKDFQVLAFTATQIPDIDGRKYPSVLAGPLYPDGIPIYKEEGLPRLIKELGVDEVVFSYSDIFHENVMHKASIVLAAGAGFVFLGPNDTMIPSKRPLVSVCAVRTGCGKSQTTRKIALLLKEQGKKVVVIRHPMPYGDLAKQRVQRFATYDDMMKHKCTIEEMEEYEHHIQNGIIVYAGVDYGDILAEAEKEADVILWDGGNNDIPFYKADIEIVVVDPHRPGHERLYHPGETNFRRAQVIIINKMATAKQKNIEVVENNIKICNPEAVVIKANSPITVPDGEKIRGKSVLVIEDGPTLTHGEMPYGAGIIAAEQYGAGKIIDPRPYAVGSIKDTFAKYSHLDRVLPAMGYGQHQIDELTETINNTDCDLVIGATPIDLGRLIQTNKKILRVTYDLEEIGKPDLNEVLQRFK
ncbi:MAG: cyclic 2,3-diphosphoglycerate synthase [Acidobacteria bacterium]|nr:cyclic 2,3-diphosphoglycerate synthase [Acidobacteriota bacterium]MBU1475121.1 cyclic 2,3-diphosphoglycerate synthase [Acidobacteriota bacterium]